MSESPSGWFAYSPADPSSIDRLTDQQREIIHRHQQHDEPWPVAEIHILMRNLEPGHGAGLPWDETPH